MSKITNDGLTWSGTGCFILYPNPYSNSGHQRVNFVILSITGWLVERQQIVCLNWVNFFVLLCFSVSV